MLRDALATRERSVGVDQPPTVESRAMLGACLVATGAVEQGRRLYASARGPLQTARGPDDRLVKTLAQAVPL
jgi:hypothetical protein